MQTYLTWFDEISRRNAPEVGGKGANLGEMTRAGFPVPPGFVVTTDAFLHALTVAGVREDVRRLFAAVSPDDPAALAESSEQLRALVAKVPLPPEVQASVAAAYAKLGADVAVAVRSSATSEDAETTSFAGMHESFTNVVGLEALTERIHACWMSAYGQRVLAYRKSQGMDEEPTLAVVVQRMVNAARSGVMFTADPSTNDTSTIVIEAAFGLGEVVVGGQVEVDTYDLTKAVRACGSFGSDGRPSRSCERPTDASSVWSSTPPTPGGGCSPTPRRNSSRPWGCEWRRTTVRHRTSSGPRKTATSSWSRHARSPRSRARRRRRSSPRVSARRPGSRAVRCASSPPPPMPPASGTARSSSRR